MLAFPPDISFVIQIISFLILFAGLKQLIFDPTLRVIEERQRRTSGAKHAAADLRAESATQSAEYEAEMQQARLAVGADSEAARARVEAEERAIVTAARDQASAELNGQRDRLTRESAEARVSLAGEAELLAKQMFEQVVGRPSI